MPRPYPLLVRALGAAMVAALVVFGVHAVTRLGGAEADRIFGTYVYQATKALGIALIVARVVLVRAQRAAFAVLAFGLVLSLGGDIAWGLLYRDAEGVPVPSLADVFWVSAYVPFGIAVALLVSGTRARRAGSGLWLDGLIVASALLTVMAYLVLPPVLAGWRGMDLKALLTSAAYPVGDAVVVAALLSSLALRNWRLDLRCGLLALAFGSFVVADGVYLVQLAQGTYVTAGLLDLGWLLAGSLGALAAWLPTPSAQDATRSGSGRVLSLVPSAAGTVAIGLLVIDHVGARTEWLLAPVCAIALLIFARFSLLAQDNHRLIEHNRRDAVTDALTGLANRRRLMEDLEVTSERDRVLIIFDLDGFKLYNDTFGHPAGDVLLQIIGAELRAAIGEEGTAYRLGGDEFCALLTSDADAQAVGARLAAAMARDGHGFTVSASFGTTIIPAAHPTPARAIAEADERLYACKHERRSPGGQQSTDVLLAVVAERIPDLGEHGGVVADLAAAVAGRLGMEDGETEHVRHAGALHDIGKMAIPDAILAKPGPLTEEEWQLMRQHTAAGERILGAAPALRPVAALVRASHEHWDGTGYPDALAGEEIPLGARVIAACDAFDAMTSERPYARPRSPEGALAELERCAGSHFDARVVAALADELEARRAEPAALLLERG